jgi:hypothetical protein
MAQSEDIQRLVVLLEARTAAFEKAMTRATASANRSAKQIETRFTKMQRSMSSSFAMLGRGAGLLGVSLAASTIISKFSEVTEAADDLVDASDRLGIPIAKLQDLAQIAKDEGLDFKAMTGGLDKFLVNLVEATTKGGDFQKTLELNGITLSDIGKLIDNPSKGIEVMAELIRKAGSEAEAETIAIMAFGRAAGPELASALRRGKKGLEDAATAVDKIGRLTPEQVKALAAANKQIEAFQKTLGYYTAIAAAEGIEGLNKFIDHINSDLTPAIVNFLNNPSVRTFLEAFFGEHGPILINGKPLFDITNAIAPDTAAQIATVREDIEGVKTQIAELAAAAPQATTEMEQFAAAIRGVEIEKLNTQLAELQSKLAQLEGGAQIPVSIMTPASTETPTTRYTTTTTSTGTTTSSTSKPAPVTVEGPVTVAPDSAFHQQLEALAAGGGSRYGPEQEPDTMTGPDFAFTVGSPAAPVHEVGVSAADEVAASVEAANDSIESTTETTKIWTTEMEEAAAAADQQAEKVASVTSNLQFEREQLGRTAREQAIYNELHQAGVDINSAAGQQIAELAGALYDEQQSLQIIIQDMDLLRDSAKDFAETLIHGLIDGADASEVLGDALERLASRLISSGLDQLFSAILGPPGTPGILGAIFGRQTGGPVNAGQVYKVHQDELIVPRGPATVIPAGAANKMAGDGAWNVHYNPSIIIQGNADQNTARAIRDQLFRDMENALPGALKRSYRNRALR